MKPNEALGFCAPLFICLLICIASGRNFLPAFALCVVTLWRVAKDTPTLSQRVIYFFACMVCGAWAGGAA